MISEDLLNQIREKAERILREENIADCRVTIETVKAVLKSYYETRYTQNKF